MGAPPHNNLNQKKLSRHTIAPEIENVLFMFSTQEHKYIFIYLFKYVKW